MTDKLFSVAMAKPKLHAPFLFSGVLDSLWLSPFSDDPGSRLQAPLEVVVRYQRGIRARLATP